MDLTTRTIWNFRLVRNIIHNLSKIIDQIDQKVGKKYFQYMGSMA